MHESSYRDSLSTESATKVNFAESAYGNLPVTIPDCILGSKEAYTVVLHWSLKLLASSWTYADHDGLPLIYTSSASIVQAQKLHRLHWEKMGSCVEALPLKALPLPTPLELRLAGQSILRGIGTGQLPIIELFSLPKSV